jgi:hypothetical protein
MFEFTPPGTDRRARSMSSADLTLDAVDVMRRPPVAARRVLASGTFEPSDETLSTVVRPALQVNKSGQHSATGRSRWPVA